MSGAPTADAHTPGPDRIWVDLNIGIWLGRPQPDRAPEPPTEYVRGDLAADLVKALEDLLKCCDVHPAFTKPTNTITIGRMNAARAALTAAKTGGAK